MTAAPLRGTQSLVGEMGWVFARPSLTAIEVAWRWLVGAPLLVVCWREAQRILALLPPESTGLAQIDKQNPWNAAVQLADAWAIYWPHAAAVLCWLLPAGAVAWAVASGVGRSLLLKRMAPEVAMRPAGTIVLQAVWMVGLGAACWAWFATMQWNAAAHITAGGEPDLVGYSVWAIFLSLGFFTAWALVSWALSIAPLLMLLEGCSAWTALGRSVRLGKTFTGKLIEINLVMGIVKLALIVVAMVISAAPLPFSDELGPGALRAVLVLATFFYLVASDYFEVVRLKGFVEFWKAYAARRHPYTVESLHS